MNAAHAGRSGGANPFNPSFGVSPPFLAGREDYIDQFEQGLDDGVNSPYRSMLVTGHRGSGKTALLNRYEDIALDRNWFVIAETLTIGLANRIAQQSAPDIMRQLRGAPLPKLTGFNTPFGGVSVQPAEGDGASTILRGVLTEVLDELDKRGRGLLLTVDEVHAEHTIELEELAVTVQHLRREGRPFAFIAAGLPNAVSDVLNANVTTFLRRAERQTLGLIDISDVRDALEQPILQHGRTIDADALEYAAGATRGYPFLIQQVGFHIWQESAERININSAAYGSDIARRQVSHQVAAPTLDDLSTTDRAFLVAMAVDPRSSDLDSIMARMDVTVDIVEQHRNRLLDSMVVRETGTRLAFAIPLLREHLIKVSTSEVRRAAERETAARAAHYAGPRGGR